MKHKHYDLIVAKAADMNLVVLSQNQKDGSWLVQNDQGTTDFGECINYFLCLPQHKEACLHWLNGGESEHGGEFGQWNSCEGWNKKWFSTTCGFMRSSHQTRIKPKKEKRWIATFPWAGNVFYVTPESFASEGLLNDYVDMHYGKRDLMLIHEIEVEV
jgi:hypothetical protein